MGTKASETPAVASCTPTGSYLPWLGLLWVGCAPGDVPPRVEDPAELVDATHWTGPTRSEFGTALALSTAGDAVLVTAPHRLHQPYEQAWLVPASGPGGAIEASATASFVGTGSGWGYNALLEDVNVDGVDDVLLEGSAYIYSSIKGGFGFLGPHEGTIDAQAADLTWSLGTAGTYKQAMAFGDVTGDDQPDLLMYYSPDRALDEPGIAVWHGPPNSGGHDYVLRHPGDEYLGWNVHTAQLDADTEMELVAMSNSAGEVWALDAGPQHAGLADHGRLVHRADDATGTEYVGNSLATGRFTAHDGPTLSTSSHGWGERGGRVDLYAMNGLDSDWFAGIRASDPGRFFGNAQCVADFDGDGVDDLAVGATGDPYSADQPPGRVYLFAGPIPPGEHLAEDLAVRVLRVSDESDSFGYALACDDGRLFATARYASDGRGLFRLDDLTW